MTRAETIAVINAKLASLDDEGVQAVADIVQELASDDALPRCLTERELALVEQSKRDFAEGRTFSLDEAEAYIDAELARRRQQRTSK